MITLTDIIPDLTKRMIEIRNEYKRNYAAKTIAFQCALYLNLSNCDQLTLTAVHAILLEEGY